MTANARIRRERLLQIYSKNLSFYRPDFENKFLCPICLDEFSDPSKLARAHVIPDSVGGKHTTLVCIRCDSVAGSRYDRHLATEKEYFDDLKTSSATYVVFQPKRNKGIRVVADLSGMRDPKPHMDFSPPLRTSQETWREFFSEEGPGDTLEFLLEFPPKPLAQTIDWKKRNLSLIYASYLMMFYQFGYEYVLSENAEFIRQAISDESMSIDFRNAINRVVWGTMGKPFSLPSFGVSRLSKDLCFMSTLVPFDNKSGYTVQLPGFGAKGKAAYDTLLQMNHGTVTFDTKIIPNDIFCKFLDDPTKKNIGQQVFNKISVLPI
jgi:hypothetical protein